MAAYRADIEIGVVGAARLKELQDRITKLSRAIDDANVKTFIDNKAVQSLGEYSGAAGKAAANLRETAIQLNAAGKASGNYADAISQLVTAVGQENSALKIQNNLIKEEIELRRKAKLAASGIRETTQYAGPIGPGQASPVGSLVGQKSPVEERIRRTLVARKEELNLQEALLRLEEKSSAELNKQLEARKALAQTSAIEVRSLIARAAAGPQATQLLLAAAAPGAPAMGGGARRRITGQVERLGGARTADEAAATLRLAQATDALVQSTSKIDPQYNRFLPDTAALNATGRGIKQLTTNQEQFNQTVQRGIRFEEKYNQELERRRRLGIGGPTTNRMPGVSGVTGGPFPVAGPIPLSQFGQGRRVEAGAALRKRAGGALGNALIGGAFPLLFGQGAGAAAGGAIGGLVGGAFGGVGGFAGSLVGTLLGDIASQGQKVKQLAEDIGFSAEQTKKLSDAFKVANTDVEKFTAVIQNIRGIGLELEDQARAIQLVTRLTELYGGSFEKTGNAITSALESGKVTQATLNQLTSQGINIQQALADKFDVNRDAILKMAKDGKISVQSLIDTLVDLGNAPGEAAKKTQTATQLFQTAIQNLTKVVGPELERLAQLFLNFGATALNALTNVLTRLGQVGTAIENKIAGPTLKNAQQQFKRDAQTLKGLYATPKGERTQQQVQQIMALERLQKGRMEVIQGAQPKAPTKLETFTAPSQAAGKTASDKATKDAERLAQQRQKQLEAAARMAVLTEGELQKAVAVTEQEKLNTDYAQQRMERMVKYETLYKEALSNAEIEYLLMAQSNEILAENYKYQKDLLDIALQQSQVINKADPLASAQQELELLRAKIQGTEKEYIIQKQINDLINQNADPEDARGLILTIQDLEKQNKAIETQKQLWADIYTTVSGEIQNAITGLIKGTAQWGDVLSSILSGLGNLFLNAAFTGLGGALKLPGFASGGFVTRPTTAVVGEGGEPEYVIPASKMRSAMGRYASGARGSNVLSAGGDTGEMGGAATMAPAAIDVRYSVERINNVDYVTADQFQAGMAQAAQQGAIQGERRAMRTLTNSAAARGRLRI